MPTNNLKLYTLNLQISASRVHKCYTKLTTFSLLLTTQQTITSANTHTIILVCQPNSPSMEHSHFLAAKLYIFHLKTAKTQI